MAEFEISKDGMKIPYKRFMADTASGMTLYLMGFVIYAWADFPFIDSKIRPINEGATLFLGIILFFLSTALGGVLTGISWFILGNFTTKIYEHMYVCAYRENKSIYKGFIIWLNKRNYTQYQFEKYKSFFGLTKDNWTGFYYSLKGFYRYSSDTTKKFDLNLDAVSGGIAYIRNIALLILLAIMVSLAISKLILASVLFFIFLFLFILVAVETNYMINNTFQCAYLYLMDKIDSETINGDFSKIQKLLLN